MSFHEKMHFLLKLHLVVYLLHSCLHEIIMNMLMCFKKFWHEWLDDHVVLTNKFLMLSCWALICVNCDLSFYLQIPCCYVDLSCNSCYNMLFFVGMRVLSLSSPYKVIFSVIRGLMFFERGDNLTLWKFMT